MYAYCYACCKRKLCWSQIIGADGEYHPCCSICYTWWSKPDRLKLWVKLIS